MDPAPALGIGAAFVLVILFNVLEGGTPTSVLLFPPMLLVFGVSMLVAIAGGTFADAKRIPASLVRAFAHKVVPAEEVIPDVVMLAERARREGLLALEENLATLDDEFLAKGVTLAIDGTDPEELREILESEMFAKQVSEQQGAKFFNDTGGYAPTIGIVGTVMGLVNVLENLSTPESLGPLIAAAFLATFWGVAAANLIYLPIGARLERLSELECARMEMVIEGIAAIQAGSNPRIIAQKLRSLSVNPDVQAEAA